MLKRSKDPGPPVMRQYRTGYILDAQIAQDAGLVVTPVYEHSAKRPVPIHQLALRNKLKNLIRLLRCKKKSFIFDNLHAHPNKPNS